MDKQQSGADISTELARERTRDAADRTLMAWIRTSLSLISFGFAVGKALHILKTAGLQKSADPLHSDLIFATSFIILGIISLLVGIIQYRQLLKRLEQPSSMDNMPRRLTMMVAILLLAIGLFALVAILVR